MQFFELLIIAVGLSMDAFAIAICSGLTMRKAIFKKALIVGLYFGVSQAVMPLFGYMLASRFANAISAYDHWIALILLGIIGGKMIRESFQKEGCADRECPADICVDRKCPGGERPNTKEISLTPADMLPVSLATSIDAMAVGVSFAFLQIQVVPAVLIIGTTTFALSVAGTKIGNVFGTRFKAKSELAGGMILVLMGLKIWLEHMGIIG